MPDTTEQARDNNPAANRSDLEAGLNVAVPYVDNASLVGVLAGKTPAVGGDFVIATRNHCNWQGDAAREKVVSLRLEQEIGIEGVSVEIVSGRGMIGIQVGLGIEIQSVDAKHFKVSVGSASTNMLAAWERVNHKPVKSVLKAGVELFEYLLRNAEKAEPGIGLDGLKRVLTTALEQTKVKLADYEEPPSLPKVPKKEGKSKAENTTPEEFLEEAKKQSDLKSYSWAFVLAKFGANLAEHNDLWEKFTTFLKLPIPRNLMLECLSRPTWSMGERLMI